MEKANTWLGERLVQLASPVPAWVWYSLLGALLLVAFATFTVALYRLMAGDELKTKWFTLRSSRSVRKREEELEQTKNTVTQALANLKREYEAIYHLSSQRRVLLDATSNVVGDLAAYFAGDLLTQPDQFLAKLYRLSLKALLSALRDDAQNPLRVGLFIPDPEDSAALMLVDSCSDGFTAMEVQSKRLSVKESAAGFVFLTGKEYANAHLSLKRDGVFKPRADGAFPYESLICVPVRIGTVMCAVLSVDSPNPNAFGQEEIRYIRHTALLVSLGLSVMESQGAGFAEVASAPDPHERRSSGGVQVDKRTKGEAPR